MARKNVLRILLCLAACLVWATPALPATVIPAPAGGDFLEQAAALKDRSLGSKGCAAAADMIEKAFTAMGAQNVGRQYFRNPVLRDHGSHLSIPSKGVDVPLQPLSLNAISPGTLPETGAAGPVIYAGQGRFKDFKGQKVQGAIVLMDLDSGKHWLNAATLGARALIFVHDGPAMKGFLQEKRELSPLDFPRFFMDKKQAERLFGELGPAPRLLANEARIFSRVLWEQAEGENVYGLIPGSDPNLKNDLLTIHASFDSTPLVLGDAPGAGEAVSADTLLAVGRYLSAHPPKRSVLLLATGGGANSLAGLREFFYAATAKSSSLNDRKEMIGELRTHAQSALHGLQEADPIRNPGPAEAPAIYAALDKQVRDEVDRLSLELMQVRMQTGQEAKAREERLQEQRFLLRRISWKQDYAQLTAEEAEALRELLPNAIREQENILKDAKAELKIIRSQKQARALVRGLDWAAFISLHLSSHGNAIGAFNKGWFYELVENVNRVQPYSVLNDALNAASAEARRAMGDRAKFVDSLRPSRIRPWQTYLPDKPQLGGEIASMAGVVGVTLCTVNDMRQWWATPFDTLNRVDRRAAADQAELAARLVKSVADSSLPLAGRTPRNGFSTLVGRANFIRQGELFPDRPAPEAVLLAYQGPTRLYAMVDSMGEFRISGLADSKHTVHKVVLEGYRFSDQDGRAVWAIDKEQSGKDAYRVKMRRTRMETDLIMFGCRQTTLFDMITPRTFRYMTKIDLFDARREAEPLRYWFSRLDTRDSTILSVFLDPGAPMKLALSDNRIDRKEILTHAVPGKPLGVGYNLERWPIIPATEYRAAYDMWSLLDPRIKNLNDKGVANARILQLERQGRQALKRAEKARDNLDYETFMREASTSLSLASRVYKDVDGTLRDVLMGVLFYIALFAPFAFCMERLLFGSADIHKRIIGFLGLLLATIAVVYMVHPAFELTTSPTVVILAFFIVGLSVMVSLIIFFRFEKEMAGLQLRASQLRSQEVSKWRAFTQAFVIGVSNLRRRKLRTALTCATLVILTFTIMSFTAVKSVRLHTAVQFSDHAPYNGVMMKNLGWLPFPSESFQIAQTEFPSSAVVTPRAWLQEDDPTLDASIEVRKGGLSQIARGVIGLSSGEPGVSGVGGVLTQGRWLGRGQAHEILLPENLASRLNASPGDTVRVWGVDFTVAGLFSGEKFEAFHDLDGETMTPVTFPSDTAREMTEAEAEAIETGDDTGAFTGRYKHVPAEATIIVPFDTLMAMGGELVSMASSPASGRPFSESFIQELVDRFGLTIFVGSPAGTAIHQASNSLNYSGVPNILIPLVISALIVLNTMIASVFERKKEIAVYTSVGMAPTHVSYLFIAEALAFAVISVVLGYLLAQTSAWLLSGTSLWAGMTANYSSLAGVAAMALVIAVVLVSVIYPSKVAGEIAIPDVNRSWRLPENEEGEMTLALPFLIKIEEQRCAAGYLLEYFEAHKDVSHGLFSSDDTDVGFVHRPLHRLARQAGASPEKNEVLCISFEARTWLAPFDFGVKQYIRFDFQPSTEQADYLEMRLTLRREAGEIGAWRRMNKGFVNAVRKQMLVFRALSHEDQHAYESKLSEMMLEGFSGLGSELPAAGAGERKAAEATR
ncbi:MAG: FtsX-like permease family protein [Desulfovibrionaceae bacterium]